MNHGFPSGAGETLWPFFLYNGLVLLVVAGIILASYLLGERHRARGRNLPYESGITPTGSARLRYGAHFYPVGIFFILFDVEAIFLYAWAVAFRELSWAGYLEALLFIIVLLLGLVYVWKLGGLDWSPSRRRTATQKANISKAGATPCGRPASDTSEEDKRED
jgi:NADH-quinone oxidoreductase subunit A